MTKYVAFLRGIMPMNPNMKNEKLRQVFLDLGFSGVESVISSGNIIFESKSKSVSLLESKIEKALKEKLGINSPAFIRSQTELETIVNKDPFKGADHGRKSYLVVTFTNKKPFEIYNSIDLEKDKTPNFMQSLEKEYGKEITTRTWKTVERILNNMV